MDQLFRPLYRLLIALACLSMVAAFVIVMLGILARQVTFIDIQGLDAYAGYAIAATLFFTLPTALMHGDNIRVTLVLDRLGQRARAGFEWGALIAALGLAVYLAWFAMRAVWSMSSVVNTPSRIRVGPNENASRTPSIRS